MAKHIFSSTLAFIAGLLIGVILLITGIGCAAFFIASGTSVEKAADMIGLDVIEQGSELGEKKLWEVGKDIYKDYHNLGNLTIKDLQKYGLKIPDDISGINISNVYDIPFKDFANSTSDTVQKLLDGITLGSVTDLVGFDTSLIPILDEKKSQPIMKAFNEIIDSVNMDKVTLRQLKYNFNVSLGDQGIFEKLMDAPFSAFGNIIQYLPIGQVLGVDYDYYVKLDTPYELYVKVDETNPNNYVAVTAADITSDHIGADRYIANATEADGLIYHELRYIKMNDGSFRVDNSPYLDSYDATKDTKTYYYHKSYIPYDGTNGEADNIYFIPNINETKKVGESAYVFDTDTYYPLNKIYVGSTHTPLTSSTGTYTFTLSNDYYYKDKDDAYVFAKQFGPDETPIKSSTRLDDSHFGYLAVKDGTTDNIMQSLSTSSIKTLNNVLSTIEAIKLGDVIQISDDSAQILQELKNTKIGKLSERIDTLALDGIMDIVYDTYDADDNGQYVLLSNGSYSLYNPADSTQVGLQRYRKTTATTGEHAGQVFINGEWKNVSSDALQRLGKSTLGNISETFESLTIGDVMNITPDTFKEVTGAEAKADSSRTYYRYDNGKYISLNETEVAALSDDAKVYYIFATSEDNAIIKKLAYMQIDALGSGMEEIINDTKLAEVIDIVYDTYTEDADGQYVKLSDGTYILYNPAIHIGETRYIKTTVGGQVEIAGVMTDVSSKALQRLGNVAIGNVGSVFSTLTIGDVMDITPDTYVATTGAIAKADNTKLYYRYDTGKYLSLSTTEKASLANDAVVYYITAQGEGNAIMRKMAYIAIDDLGSDMQAIIDDTMLNEVIDIVYDTYEEDLNGQYVKLSDGTYVLYNPAVHTYLTRYTKTTVGGQVEISGVMTDVSSKALQRIGSVQIGQVSSVFSTLTIGDVMDVTPNTYAPILVGDIIDDQIKYYRYDSGKYLSVNISTLAPTDTVYYVTAVSDDNAIMKKLAYVRIDELGNDMQAIIDDTMLSEVIDVVNDTYAEDVDGAFVQLSSGSYVLYNPADPAHSTLTRYTKTTINGMVEIGGVLTPVSSRALQRLGGTAIGEVGDAFSTLTIGDVMDVIPDVYAQTTGLAAKGDLSKTYYRYDSGKFLSYRKSEIATLADDAVVYYATIESEGNAIMKKLAYVKIDDLGDDMQTIINDTILSDIIDVYIMDQLTESTSGEEYIAPHNPNYTIKNVDGSYTYYTFVSDPNGSYFLSDTLYEIATDLEKGTATTKYFKYEPVSSSDLAYVYNKFDGTPTEVLEATDLISKFFVLSGTTEKKMINSFTLNMYVFVTCKTSGGNYANNYNALSNPGVANIFYERVSCSSTDPDGIEYKEYDGENLFVQSPQSTSEFIRYIKSDLYYANKPIYYYYRKATDNYDYYIASDEVRENALISGNVYTQSFNYVLASGFEAGVYYYADNIGSAIPFQPSDSYEYTLLTTINGGQLYYQTATYTDVTIDYRTDPNAFDSIPLFSRMDGGYYCPITKDSSPLARFTKVYCEELSVTDSLDVTTTIIGYRTNNINEIKYTISFEPYYIYGMSSTSPKYTLDHEKSSEILIAFAKNETRVGELSDVMKTFTLRDIVSVEPGSILDNDLILDSSLNDISTALSDTLTGLTVADMLVFGNITTLDTRVEAAIKDLKLEDMFGAFELDSITYELKINTIKLFNPNPIA